MQGSLSLFLDKLQHAFSLPIIIRYWRLDLYLTYASLSCNATITMINLCLLQLLAFLTDGVRSACGLTGDQTLHCIGNLISVHTDRYNCKIFNYKMTVNSFGCLIIKSRLPVCQCVPACVRVCNRSCYNNLLHCAASILSAPKFVLLHS